MNSKNMKIYNVKIIEVTKSTSKTRFRHLLLSITFINKFEDLSLIFYIWVFKTTIEVITNFFLKSQFKQHFATTFKPLTTNNWIMNLVHWSFFLVQFTILASNCKWKGLFFFSKFQNLSRCVNIVRCINEEYLSL